MHEKTILFSLLPATNLMGLLYANQTISKRFGVSPILFYFSFIAIISLFPLLRRDGQIIPFMAIVPIYTIAAAASKPKGGAGAILNWTVWVLQSCTIILVLLQLFSLVISVPFVRWPDFYSQLTASIGAASYTSVFLCTSWTLVFWDNKID